MATTKPNILFILTDQERFPRHMDQVDLAKILPSRDYLYKNGVRYNHFYINASPCTPNRSVIFTGLYTQQTWMVGNAEMQQPDLKTAFPTFGTALRELGYSTNYFGKWHLSTEPTGNDILSAYGFDNFPLGKEFHGNPNQGSLSDDAIAESAAEFLGQTHTQPFLAVVSLINPHDIMYYPRQVFPREALVNYPGLTVPENYETVESLKKSKPICQAQYKELYEKLMGDMPDDVTTEEDKKKYIAYLNYYLWLESKVDKKIGIVLKALNESDNKTNTIVIFTADHGDQIGSHGMSGKQCCVYEESLNVPFCVLDYTQQYIPASEAGKIRQKFGSSIDIFPTILSMASGGAAVPSNYSYLSGVNLLPNIKNDSNATKSEVLFTYDFNIPGAIAGPDHIRCVINQEFKGALYDHWGMDNANQDQPTVEEGAVDVREGLRHKELYKRTTKQDLLELTNFANEKGFEGKMAEIEAYLTEVTTTKLRAVLPDEMQAASDMAKAEYVELQQSEATVEEVRTRVKDYLG